MDTQTIRFIADNYIYLFAAPCIITFLLFAWDKHLAHFKLQRVPEAVLYLWCALLGAFGGLCAMIIFRHKTKNMSFKVIVPLLTVLQIAAIVCFRVYIEK